MNHQRRVLLGLGSNLGDRLGYLKAALANISDLVAVSSVYETAPVGGPEQGPYLNLVAMLQTALAPRDILTLCQRLESDAGRVRDVRWGARTLDVDVLWIDGETVAEPDLEVPHPRMFERSFVLIPLGELTPDLVPQGFDPASAAVEDKVVCVGTLEDYEMPN